MSGKVVQLKSKVQTFSAKDEDLLWLEGYKERLNGASFSKAVIDALKMQDDCQQHPRLRELDTKCRAHGHDAETILVAAAINFIEALNEQERRDEARATNIFGQTI